jgi:diadenosine tetraphosphate (Ap4A) HIT family hydrolase
MELTIPERIEAARKGSNPTVICPVPSGWVVLCDTQFLRGYCILLADPVVPSLNDLDHEKRVEFSSDMAIIGDALLEVTGAYRINYAIAGNTDPYLHAHIVPATSGAGAFAQRSPVASWKRIQFYLTWNATPSCSSSVAIERL